MVSRLALLSNLLLASVALAIPSSPLGARLRENRRSQQMTQNKNWAGSVVGARNGNITTATATFTIPTPSSDAASFSIVVAIDGSACTSTVLQTGIHVTINNGRPLYNTWHEFYPQFDYVSGFVVSGGDVITSYIVATSTTTGLVIIHNLSTNQISSTILQSTEHLCGQNAGWFVEDYMPAEGSDFLPFANFGSVNFTSAMASGSNDSVYLVSEGDISAIVHDYKNYTSISTDGDDALVQFH